MRRDQVTARRSDADFEELMAANFDDVWRFVRRRTSNSSDADDVTAQVFVTAWRRHADMPVGDGRRLWLFGVARHSLSNHHRTVRRQSNLHLRLVETVVLTADNEPPTGTLADALAQLSSDDRDLLLMRAWDGLAVGEIAILLGCTANAASLRLHKARRRLRVLIDEKDAWPDGHVPVEPTGEERR